jgi:hypothetical protein
MENYGLAGEVVGMGRMENTEFWALHEVKTRMYIQQQCGHILTL